MRMNIKKKIAGLERYSQKILSSKDATNGLRCALRHLSKEVKFFKHHSGANKIPGSMGRPMRVQIGGGAHYLKNFLNIDINPPADLIYDVREGIPLPDDSAVFLFSEHFLEHVDYPVSAKKIIKEAYRILARGGKIVIGVPDTGRVIAAYANKDQKKLREYVQKWYSKRDNLAHFNTAIDTVNFHMRDQDDSEKYAPHLWGYDREKIGSLLRWAGFRSVKEWKFDPKIANPERQFGSIYVEAKK